MPETTLLKPDLKFKRQILGLGAHDLTACYQCGTCSVVCPISTENNTFPRKEMIWVQWGLKDKALANSSLWLCHQCGTCTAYCPRDAKPSDVMAALRDYSITHYAVPPFMGRALNEPKYLPLLFAIPAIILLLVLGWLGNLTSLPEGRIVYSKFFPNRLYRDNLYRGHGPIRDRRGGGGRSVLEGHMRSNGRERQKPSQIRRSNAPHDLQTHKTQRM